MAPTSGCSATTTCGTTPACGPRVRRSLVRWPARPRCSAAMQAKRRPWRETAPLRPEVAPRGGGGAPLESLPTMTHADAKFWNDIADKYAAKSVDNMPAFERKKAITREHLRRDSNVLEIGCGT